MALPETSQQQLEWEAPRRPRAAVAAATAGILIFLSQLGQGLLAAQAPDSSFLESLQRAAQPGELGTQPSLQVPIAEWLSDHTLALLATFAAQGLGAIALAYALTFLAVATRARREAFPKIALYLPVVGGVLAGVSAIGQGAGRAMDVSSFLDGSRTVDSAQDIGLGGLSLVAEVIYYPASLALAAGIVMVSLQASRAGLLTRFLGVLGAIVGALQVIKILPLPIVQAYWLIALAVVIAGRRPAGELPAWRSGREEPWPTAKEMAAQKAKERGETVPAPEPVPAGGPSAQAAAKRKRKRRR